MIEKNNTIGEFKNILKRGTALVTASTILAIPGMQKANAVKKNIDNPYESPAYYDISLPKSVLKTVSETLKKSAPDLNRMDMLKIKELIVNDDEINNLDFIINFTNLESLTISGIHISDISALRNSTIKELIINYTSIGNEELVYLPSSIEQLTLCDCPNITDCSILCSILPNLSLLELNCLPSLKSLNFIKNMSLRSFYVNQLGIVDSSILNYLNSNEIVNNVTEEDIDNSKNIDIILNSIINDDMTVEEKIKEVTLYIIKNIEYDLNKKNESNLKPLSTALEGSGVCMSYAYLMSVMLSKLNIESYQVYSDKHAWTLVNKDGKYYFIDSTNLTHNYSFLEDIFEKYGIGLYYMQDPDSTALSYMQNADSGDISLNADLFNKIIRGKEDKNFLEKYFSNELLDLIYISALLTVLNVLSIHRYRKKKQKTKEIVS